MDTPFLIVGWKEWVAIPELELPAIKAKIDTGAATSSLHAYDIKYVSIKGVPYVRYNLHPLQKSKKITRSCLSRLYDKRSVKSSSGLSRKRPVIRVTLKIGNFEWEIEVNLTNRDSMGMRMLIGREALRGKILVNSGHKFLHGKISSNTLQKFYKK
jgi:ribosomal protein S6--L-glutamate ligase